MTQPPQYPQQYPYPPQPDPSGQFYVNQMAPPQPPKRGMSTGAILGIVAAIVVVLCVGGVVAVALAPTPKPSPRAATPGTDTVPPTTAPPAGPLASFGDGTHEVGTGPGQIPAGTYVAVVPASPFPLCMWSRLKGFSGEGKDTITFGTGSEGEKMRVTIAASDKGFETDGCGTWTKA